MLTCISRATGLSIALRNVGLFVMALAVLLSATSAASAEDRFGDGARKNGATNAGKRDDGTSPDKGGAPGAKDRGDGGTNSRGDDGGGDPGGRNSGKDNRGGTDGDSRGRGGH